MNVFSAIVAALAWLNLQFRPTGGRGLENGVVSLVKQDKMLYYRNIFGIAEKRSRHWGGR